MKKIIACLVSVLLVSALLIPLFASAISNSVQLTVSSATAKRGENVTINLSISANSNLGGATLNLGYDNTKLEFVSVVKGAAMTMATVAVANIAATQQVRLTCLDDTNAFNGSGVIMSATFKIKDTASGVIPVNLVTKASDLVDFQFNNIPHTITNGSVTVEVPLTSISLNKASTSLAKGATETLTVTKDPAETTDTTAATWSSSNTSVATVSSSGLVTAVGAGSATITANVNGKTATCTVNVTVPLTGISINKATSALKKGQTDTLSITYTPADTTDSKTVTWSTSDATVATVANGVVTAKKAGNATITATVGTFSKTCAVTVTEIPLNSIALSKSTTTILKSRTDTLTVVVNPADTTDDLGTATWQTSDATVATVANGVVTGVKAGTATITGTLNGKTATCEVTVTVPAITIGQYSTAPTNQDLTVTATAENGTLNAASHTFTANGSFEFVATDAAGNTDRKTVTISNIDKTAPVITVKDDDNKVIVNNGVVPFGKKVTVSTDDGTMTIKKDTVAFTVPEDGKIVVEGIYEVTATDALGNTSKAMFMIVKMAVAGGKSDTTTTVKIEYADNIVPENVQLVVAPVAKDNLVANAKIAIEANGVISAAYDITLKSGGIEIQPNGKIKVYLPIPTADAGKAIKVMHIKDDGTVEEIVATIANGFAVFETDHFSNYVLVTEKPKTPTTSPVTGDATQIFFILLLITIVGMFILAFVKQKKLVK